MFGACIVSGIIVSCTRCDFVWALGMLNFFNDSNSITSTNTNTNNTNNNTTTNHNKDNNNNNANKINNNLGFPPTTNFTTTNPPWLVRTDKICHTGLFVYITTSYWLKRWINTRSTTIHFTEVLNVQQHERWVQYTIVLTTTTKNNTIEMDTGQHKITACPRIQYKTNKRIPFYLLRITVTR